MFAWIFDSLSRRADKWVGEWGSNSDELSRQRYPVVHRLVRLFSEHPTLHSFALWLFSFVISIVCWVLPHKFGFQIAATEYSQSDLLTYFSTLWTLQATLAALVYPLVIAFVAVMLQRRAAAKLSLHLYTIDAGVAPSGASALALVAWMTVLYLALPYAPLDCIAPAMVGCILWFLHNLLITGWFLYRTVTFLDDSQRYQVFKRFAIRVAFPREVHSNLLGLMFSHAQADGTLPGISYGSDAEGPVIALYPIGDGAPVVTIGNAERRTVIDVRLRPLRWGIRLWLRKVAGTRRLEATSTSPAGKPMLVLPFTPGERQPETITVCRVENGPPPGVIAIWLIRHSLVIKLTTNGRFEFTCADILEELVIETLTLVEQRRYEAAKETVVSLIDVHAGLIKAGAYKNSEGQPDNAALLPSPYSFAAQAFHQEWLRAYRPLSETAVQNLAISPLFFERACYFSYGLVGRLKSEHLDVLVAPLQLSSNLMYQLGLWWTGQVQERGITEHDANKAALLALPQGALYERALQHFVEGWEAIRIRGREVPFTTPTEAWEFNSKYARFAGAQLSSLCRMILSAVSRGDSSGAKWLSESFAKWFSSQFFLNRHYVHDNGRSKFMTFQDFQRPWDDIRREIGVDDGVNEIALAETLTTRLLQRYWTDLRLVMVLILLDWVDPSDATGSYALDLASQLISGRNPRTGSEEMDKLVNPESILSRIQRIHATSSYCALFDRLVSEATDIRRPSMVAGRVHSYAGADDLQSLCRAQGYLLTAITTFHVRGTPNLRALLNNFDADVRGLSRASRYATEVVDGIDESERAGDDIIADVLQHALTGQNNLSQSRDWARELLREFSSKAALTGQSAIAAAPISQPALRSIRRFASAYILGEENNQFPFTISKSIEPAGSQYAPGHRSITGVRKQPLTLPPLETFSEHDYDHYGPILAASIGTKLVQEHIARRALVPLPNTPASEFGVVLTAAAQAITAAGKTPLLIFSSQPPPWAGTYHSPDDSHGWPISLTNSPPRDTDVPSLICYWNDVEAHRVGLAGDGCYLVEKEDFERVTYAQTTPAGDCLDFEIFSETDITVRLDFTWTVGLPIDVSRRTLPNSA